MVVGGGGLIYIRSQGQNPSGWAFNIPLELLERLSVPLAVYAVGYNYRAYMPQPEDPHMVEHVRAVAERAVFFSAREGTTIARLRDNWAIRTPIDLVPDPSIHVRPEPVKLPGLDPGRPKIGLCLRLDFPQHRFPPPWKQNFDHFLSEVFKALNHLIKRRGFQVVHVPHILTAMDVEVG